MNAEAWMMRGVMVWGVVCCVVFAACQTEEAGETAAVDSTAEKPAAPEVTYDSAAMSPEAWLADRYGAEQGMVELELVSAGETTEQVRYFRDHGRTEALYWYATGPEAKPFVSVLQDDLLRFRGVADTKVQQVRWSPDLPIALPNFRNLNDAMRAKYDLEEIESREYLGREAKGYIMKNGATSSRVWIWEGILLYGEIDAAPNQRIDPMIVRATSLDVETPVPDEKFVLK